MGNKCVVALLFRRFFYMTRIKTNDDFINKATIIHGNRYDYSICKYVSSTNKVKIICKEHGVFEQIPFAHIKGQGCPNCGFISSSKARSMTTDDFIKKAKEKHGDTYNYNKTKYITSLKKVIITCRIHGDFYKTPNKHLNGQGCPECIKLNKNTNRKTLTKFLFEAFKKHEYKYDYSLVEYKNSKSKIKIICPIHGIFEQMPDSHIKGFGCRKCGVINSKIYKQKNPTGWSISNWQQQALKSKYFDSFKVYIIMCWNDEELFFKVGRTFVKTEIRFRSVFMPYNYSIIEEYIFETAKEAVDKESELKRINKNNKYLPKIHFNGIYECFFKINFDF